MMVRLKAVGLMDGLTIRLPVTQEQIGDAIGLAPVHVSRVFKELRLKGLIRTEGRTLIVRSWSAPRRDRRVRTRLPPPQSDAELTAADAVATEPTSRWKGPRRQDTCRPPRPCCAGARFRACRASSGRNLAQCRGFRPRRGSRCRARRTLRPRYGAPCPRPSACGRIPPCRSRALP